MKAHKALFLFIRISFSVMVFLLVVYGAVHLCRLGYDYGYRLFTEPAVSEAPGKDVLVQVKDGMSAGEIAKMLEEKGLVRDSRLFYVQFLLSAYRNKVEPGVYTLNTSMLPKELMQATVPPEDTETEEGQDTETEGGQDTEHDSE